MSKSISEDMGAASCNECGIAKLSGRHKDRSCTVRDIAQLSAVSTATVSRVMNRNGSVSEESRVKVLVAASRLGYSPNLNAVELGRRNGGIRRQRRTHINTSSVLPPQKAMVGLRE
jgi:hypothetical protein